MLHLNFLVLPQNINFIPSPVIQEFLLKRLIVPCNSPCNMSILPVRKMNGKDWKFVQDLRAINNIAIPRHLLVPNPHTLPSVIPTKSCYFSVIDLCSVFFSIPVEKDNHTFLPSHGNIINIPGWPCHRAIVRTPLTFLKYLKLI